MSKLVNINDFEARYEVGQIKEQEEIVYNAAVRLGRLKNTMTQSPQMLSEMEVLNSLIENGKRTMHSLTETLLNRTQPIYQLRKNQYG